MVYFSKKITALAGAGVFLAFSSLAGVASAASSFPERPVTIVMPFPAGGMGDILARLLAEELSNKWKQSVIVENKPGASGTLGNGHVMRSKPDGYTLLIAITQTVQAPSLYKDLPYDIVKDFTPISKLVEARSIFATSAGADVESLQDYAEKAAANPNKYSFGSYGVGTTAHILGEIFNKRNDIQAVHVPYKGSAPLISDMLGNHVTLTFMDMSTSLPHLESGKLKGYAVSGTERSAVAPDIPTFQELGYTGFEFNGWYGMFAPANVPADVVAKISADVGEVIRTPRVTERLIGLGLEPVGSNAEEFAAEIPKDIELWGKIIKEGGVSIEQ